MRAAILSLVLMVLAAGAFAAEPILSVDLHGDMIGVAIHPFAAVAAVKAELAKAETREVYVEEAVDISGRMIPGRHTLRTWISTRSRTSRLPSPQPWSPRSCRKCRRLWPSPKNIPSSPRESARGSARSVTSSAWRSWGMTEAGIRPLRRSKSRSRWIGTTTRSTSARATTRPLRSSISLRRQVRELR